MRDILDRHEHIALQFSGGKDSLAMLYLLRDELHRITVYWCNTGDAFPETLQTVEHVRAIAPHFVEVEGRQPSVVSEFGLPSDIVPVSHTPVGLVSAGREGPVIQERYACCFRSIMLPLHQRMIEDGITLIIRGQKSADKLKAPILSGTVENGIEYLFPLEGWYEADVMAYLRAEKAPVPRFYEVLDEAPDCMTCSAYWEKGEAKYLKRYHFPAFLERQRRLDIINEAVGGHIANFNKEVTA